MLDLGKLTDVPPYSFAELKDSLHGAAGLARTSSRSFSHCLSTTDRASTRMTRTRNEGDSWEHILDGAMACALRVCSKSHTGTRDAIQEKLYELLRNRTDAASMSIMSERALNNSNTLWGPFTAIERRVSLSMLGDLQEDLEIKCAYIKTALASS